MFLHSPIRVILHCVLLNPAYHSNTFQHSFHEYFPIPPCSPLLNCCHRPNAIPYHELTALPTHLPCSFLYTESPPGSSPASHSNGVIVVYCRVHGTWQRSTRTRYECSFIFPRDAFVTNKRFFFFKP